jgi:hypothetical protein
MPGHSGETATDPQRFVQLVHPEAISDRGLELSCGATSRLGSIRVHLRIVVVTFIMLQLESVMRVTIQRVTKEKV